MEFQGSVSSSSITNTAALIFNNTANQSYANAITGSGTLTKQGVGIFTLTNTNSFIGATLISGGTLQLGNNTSTGALTGTSSITNNGNLTINRDNSFTQVTDLNDKAITGSGSFTQAGSGTTTLSLVNTYNGATSVLAGTLNVTGSLSASAVTVGPNGTIGSDGGAGARTLGAGLTIQAGGNLDLSGVTLVTDGPSSGMLTITGGQLTLADFAFTDIIDWNYAAASVGTYELIAGNFTVNFNGSTPMSVATATNFGNGKGGYFTQGSLNAVIFAIPEPTSALLGGLGLLFLLRRRR